MYRDGRWTVVIAVGVLLGYEKQYWPFSRIYDSRSNINYIISI